MTGVPHYRLLITGSRDWSDWAVVACALGELLDTRGPYTLVHGACITGADAAAHCWWARVGVQSGVAEEPHRAELFGRWPYCGPRRNAHMVRLGADQVFAFVAPCSRPRCPLPDPHDSHGTADCIERAAAADIPVRRWEGSAP
jgi:YspA, cpYpsA-related SLOG family